MFKRKAYDRLQEWKERSQGRTAVLIEGARRVGKTTLVKCFAQNEYKDYLYIDFSAASKATLDIFLNHREDVDLFLRMLQLQYGKALEPRESLVIFDEVQRFPIAREYIKHLVEDGRFDYIETGSLVSIKKNVDSIVIPSEEERIPLEPLDFEEYLWATGKDLYAEEIRKARESRTALPDGVHATCMRLFDEYMLVGGMPQSVDSFVAENDFRGCDRVKRQIIALYREDIAKFGGSDARRARAVYDDIPGQLSAANKRFKFDSLEKGSRFETYESALIWLEDARTIRNLGGRATQTHNKMPLPDRSEKGICIGVLAKIDGAQERAPVRIKSALLAETALNKSDQRVNGGNLVVALGTQLDLIVLGNTRGHDGNHGLSVLEVTILGGVADLNLRGKLSSLGRQRRCRASVQASGVNDHNVLAIHF
jgi:predicted AAA+ superfamily ATPase